MPQAWTSGTYMTIPKQNAASLHQMTGEEVDDLPLDVIGPGMKVFITEDSPSGALKAGKYYTMKRDLSGWEADGLTNHLHTSPEDGGNLSDTLIANIPNTLDYDKRFAKLAEFYSNVASGGTVVDDAANARMVLDTSGANTGRASIFDGGARQLNFAENSAFEITLQQNIATDFKTKAGINPENIEAANNPLVPSYGIEGCSSSGTVWLLWSSDGSNRSTISTTAPVVTASPTIYLAVHEVANTITLEVNGVLIASKSTDIPSAGLAALNNLYKAGIQNTAAATAKILYHHGGPIIKGMI